MADKQFLLHQTKAENSYCDRSEIRIDSSKPGNPQIEILSELQFLITSHSDERCDDGVHLPNQVLILRQHRRDEEPEQQSPLLVREVHRDREFPVAGAECGGERAATAEVEYGEEGGELWADGDLLEDRGERAAKLDSVRSASRPELKTDSRAPTAQHRFLGRVGGPA